MLGRRDEAHAEQLLRFGMGQLELSEIEVLALRKNDARKQAVGRLRGLSRGFNLFCCVSC